MEFPSGFTGNDDVTKREEKRLKVCRQSWSVVEKRVRKEKSQEKAEMREGGDAGVCSRRSSAP